MQHVDALSRSVASVHELPLERELELRQLVNPVIKQISTDLEFNDNEKFKLIEGLVYRKVGENHKFYVPDQMIPSLLRAHHDDMGHVGVEKTYQGVSQNYWFPAMKRKIFEYVNNCITCIMSNEAGNRNERETSLYPLPKGPMEVLHVDYFGPLQETSNRRKHVLVIVDAFTCFTWLRAVRSTTTKEVIKHLNIFLTFGKPIDIVTDRGTAFTSKEFTDFVKEFTVKHRLVAVAAPWANGKWKESTDSNRKNSMTKLISSPTEWGKELGNLQYIINNTYHSSVKSTPAKLMLGFDQRCYNDTLFARFTESLKNIDANLKAI